jgi:acetoacetate decarboxylase
LGLRTHWQGETLIYMLFGLVDNEPSMLCGREIWGIPKKLGKISLEWHGEALYGRAERPVGSPVSELTIQITMPRQIGPEFSRGPAGVFLRRIPSPERDGAPLVQLIKTDEAEGAELEGTESPLVFDAEASLKLSSTSNADPWGLLPVLNVRRAMYIRGGLKVLGFGRILHDFSEQR